MSDGFTIPFLLAGALSIWLTDDIHRILSYSHIAILILSIASGIAGYWAGRKQREYIPEGTDAATDHHHDDAATMAEMMTAYGFSYDTHRLHSAQRGIAIAVSYIVAGAISLLPYWWYTEAIQAFYVSAMLTLCALFALGFIKARFLKLNPWKLAFANIAIAAIATGMLMVAHRA